MIKLKTKCVLLIGCCVFMIGGAVGAVEFPGPQPGKAEARQDNDLGNGLLTLENRVIGASWRIHDGQVSPAGLTNKLTGDRYDQSGAELFRLATKPQEAGPAGVVVAIRLEVDRVVALASRNGMAWTELASFPRADFPGEPKMVRLGKMNLKAQSKNNPGDLGVAGESIITEITPVPATMPSGRFALKAGAHEALTAEYSFPAGSKFLSCRIDKGSDQGMSWGPALALVWEEGNRFLLVGVRDKQPTFNITTASGEIIKSVSLGNYPSLDLPASKFRLARVPKVVPFANQIGGVAIEADLISERGIHAHWRAELRDDSNYIRQTVLLSVPDKPVPLLGVELVDLRIPEARTTEIRTIGTVPGCPVVAGHLFCGVEMPGAQNSLDGTSARIGFACQLELSPSQPYTFSAVTGVAPTGQLRRAFLYYLERERARPSKPFLHYNCWYDLGFSLDAKKLLATAKSFDEELVKKRGVPVLSYLADDGWDDPGKGLWVEQVGKFPHGFAGLNDEMKPLGAHLAVWISPLGGYGGAKERTGWARKMGLIPATSELDLAHPAYKQWFQDRCLQLMREAGVNAFKWDRAGEGVSPHFMALLDIARNLRRQDPDVFINVTVGTWPSPFWLNHVDSTWRNGSADVGWAGKGDDREKWLTFRDGYCRKLFVEQSPLYPLNSVMHHGIVHGRCFQGEKVGKSGANLKNEARSYFANGTMLQELYLTPSMMTPEAWDQVAESARWAHANADVLVDAHWVGGDPLKLEPYGYAAWNPRKATLMIRNPDDQPQSMALEAGKVFELPAGAAPRYALTSPYKDQRIQTMLLEAGQPATITLEPFEVLVFDAVPRPVNKP